MKINQFDFDTTTPFNRGDGVVDQVDHGLLNLLAIEMHLRDGQIAFDLGLKLDMLMSLFIQGHSFFNNRREIAGGQIRSRKACKSGELIDKVAYEIDMVNDHAGTLVENRIVNLARVFALQPLGREGNRRKGVFYLMCNPAGDFAPGCHALGLLQLGQVIENHDDTHVVAGIVF